MKVSIKCIIKIQYKVENKEENKNLEKPNNNESHAKNELEEARTKKNIVMKKKKK